VIIPLVQVSINKTNLCGKFMMTQPTDDFTTTIVAALQKRDFVHRRVTNAVAKKIDFVFEAIIEHLDQNAHTITWESIETTKDLLVIVAKVPSYEQMDGSSRVVTVGIPLDVIQHQSKDKVLEFFSFVTDGKISNDNDDEELEDYGDVDDEPNIEDNKKTIKRVLH